MNKITNLLLAILLCAFLSTASAAVAKGESSTYLNLIEQSITTGMEDLKVDAKFNASKEDDIFAASYKKLEEALDKPITELLEEAKTK